MRAEKATAALLALASCGGPLHQKDEASVTYRAAFSSEAGVNTKVLFPFPDDGAQLQVERGLVSSGGSFRLESSAEGVGLSLEGRGRVEVSFRADKVKGLGEGGIPQASLTRSVPDGGIGDRYVRVNKGGSATLPIEFEYTAARECGDRCGGRRSWTFSGNVGLALQEVSMSFVEEQRQ